MRTAMRFATAFADAEVLAPLQLPWPESEGATGQLCNCIAVWGTAMFGVEAVLGDNLILGPVHLPPCPAELRPSADVGEPGADGGSPRTVGNEQNDCAPNSKAKFLLCVRTAWALRAQRLGYAPKNTCHLSSSTAKQPT